MMTSACVKSKSPGLQAGQEQSAPPATPLSPWYKHQSATQLWNKTTTHEFFDGKKSHKLQLRERLFLDDAEHHSLYNATSKQNSHTQ